MTTRSLLTVIFAVALAAVGAVWIKSLVPPESPSGSLQFLSAAAELPIYDKVGTKTDLAKEKGKIFIIHFWATWCPPCVEEIPALSRFWDKYRTRDDISLYAISVDKDWKTIEDFMKKNPSEIPLFLDPECGDRAAVRYHAVSGNLRRQRQGPCALPRAGRGQLVGPRVSQPHRQPAGVVGHRRKLEIRNPKSRSCLRPGFRISSFVLRVSS